jgi:chromosome segregation ATPase
MMGVMADRELDELYAAPPEQFTALRTELAKAARKRGDAEAAKRISEARKPTTAAWVVNSLVHTDADARDRLRDLSAQLRDAHAEMDGERIRALSAEQRQLVSRLSKAAFAAAELANPSAALRDDVTATLQAAIADPEVAARLGTLAKAEQWSGFGFGVSTAKGPATKKAPPARQPEKHKPGKKRAGKPPADDGTAQRRRDLEQARTAMAEARQAKTDTDKALAQRHTELAAARTRHEEAQRRLRTAERDLQDAEQTYHAAEQAGLDAGARIAELRERMEQLRA